MVSVVCSICMLVGSNIMHKTEQYWTCGQCCCVPCMWDVCSNIVSWTEHAGHVVSVVCSMYVGRMVLIW